MIENCNIKKAHGGFVIGSEMSGGIRNVLVRNCYYDGTDVGIRMKSRIGRGGFIKNIWAENITMKTIMTEAIRINMHYGAWGTLNTNDKIIDVGDIYIKNIRCVDAKRDAISIDGLPQKPLEQITFENIDIGATTGVNASMRQILSLSM